MLFSNDPQVHELLTPTVLVAALVSLPFGILSAGTALVQPQALLAGLAYRKKLPGGTPLFYAVVASLIMPSIIVSLGIGLLFRLLDAGANAGMELTESFAMTPPASVRMSAAAARSAADRSRGRTLEAVERVAVGELLDRVVTLRDSGDSVTVRDVAIERDREKDWKVTRLFVQRASSGPLGLRRGETFTVRPDEVSGLAGSTAQQGATALLATMEDLKPADLADVLSDLPLPRQVEVAAELSDERLADAVEEFSDDDAVALISALDTARAADVLDAMEPDDAADLVGELPQEKAAELLGLMQPDEAEDVRRLMTYDEYTAGGLMTTEPIILPPEATVATFLAHARKSEVPPALAAVAFVCRPPLEAPTGRFLGMIHLQRALRERPQRMVGSIVDNDLEQIGPDDSIGTVTRLLATYNLTAYPVVDDAVRLLGAVSVDDVLDHLMPDDWRDNDDEVTDETIERNANA